MIYILGIFLIVLFLYLHIFFHLKTSNDLVIYDIETPSKDKLEEICDLRQPVIFPFYNEEILEKCSRQMLSISHGVFDVKLRNLKNNVEDDEELYVPVSFNNSLQLIKNDSESQYLIENNGDFIEETTLKQTFKTNDGLLRPYAVSKCEYDLSIGSIGGRTPFRYELNYRNYFYVTEGSVKVKLSPPKSARYLSEVKDYDNFEFVSPVNPWDVQEKYKAEFSKVKCLELNITKGQIIFIPAYWWYSIEFREDTTLCVFKYKTYMNTLAILPQLLMRILQSHNIKRISFNKMNTNLEVPIKVISVTQPNEQEQEQEKVNKSNLSNISKE